MFESNYFVIEREKNFADYIVPERGYDEYDIINMNFDEVMQTDLSGFVVSIMDFANMYFDELDEETTVTLCDPDGFFLWSVIIGIGEGEDELVYKLVDWTKGENGSKFRYADE